MGISKKRFDKFLWIALLLVLALVACQPAAPEVVTEVVEVTRMVTETVVQEGETVEVTRVVTETVVEEGEMVEVTRVVTPTETPLPTGTATPDFGSLAYDVPNRMNQEETVQIILLVSPSEDASLAVELNQQLEEVEQQPNNVVTATIKMSKRMSASLTGVPESAFEIVPLQAHDEQPIYDDKPTRWEWTVLPKEGGTHTLILRVDRLVEIEGIIEHLREEVYRDDITVRVPFWVGVKRASASLFSFNGFVGVLVIAILAALFNHWLVNRGND